jgi:hypothetical protein
MPPPPPSSSYNLVIVDSSDEENDDVYTVNNAYAYNSLPWADCARDLKVAGNGNEPVEATDVKVLGSTEDDSDDESDEDLHAAEMNDVNSEAAPKKKKKNKKKSKKKKKKKSKIEEPTVQAAVPAVTGSTAAETKSKKHQKVSFGTVSVREYARTLGTHTVPLDGGWPLGLGELAAEHTHQSYLEHQNNHPSSPKHGHHTNHGWLVQDFETRKQIELTQRYEQLIRDQRRRKFEKEWEKKNMSKFHASHSYNTRKGKKGSSKSGSLRASKSGSTKLDMTCDEKEEMERIVTQPVEVPGGCLETRQYDYKPRIKPVKVVDPNISEAEELIMNHKGRNPLFGILSENERKKRLERDDAWFRQCHEIDDRCRPSNGNKNDPIDLTDPTITQHIQHDLETLRIQRSATNQGCSCRKLHVFIPGLTDKSHHKKKGSHRRLPERKVREELRRRGLPADGNREKMEKALHDAIEKEPCCWGNDCPCVSSGIGCQADTCSCWHPSHEGATHGGGAKKENTEAKSVVDQDVVDVEERCGNVNGMYVVNFGEIRRYRERYVVKSEGVEAGAN